MNLLYKFILKGVKKVAVRMLQLGKMYAPIRHWCWVYTILYSLFPGGPTIKKNMPCNEWDMGQIPGSGRTPRERNGNSLKYSCLENSKDRGTWWATVHGITKSWTWLSNWTTIADSLSHPDKTKSATRSNLMICEMALSQNCFADLRKIVPTLIEKKNYSKITDIVVQDSSGRTGVSCHNSYTVSEWLIQRKFRWWSLLAWHNIH